MRPVGAAPEGIVTPSGEGALDISHQTVEGGPQTLRDEVVRFLGLFIAVSTLFGLVPLTGWFGTIQFSGMTQSLSLPLRAGLFCARQP